MQAVEKQSAAAIEARRREVVVRVASSPVLQKSARLRELFLYLCERTLRGEAVDLRESTVGEAVFGRPRGYDTSADNIVRVNVFQLRKKLEQYFAEEGSAEPVVIAIPKGHYIVEFQERATRGLTVPPPVAPVAVRPASGRRWRLTFAALAALGAITALAWLWSGSRSNTAPGSDYERFWGSVFAAGRDAYIVVADSGFGLLQDVTGRRMGLDDYLKQIEIDAPGNSATYRQELIRRLIVRQYTSVVDATIAFRLGAVNQALGGKAVIRSSRSIDRRDLKMHNVVLLGSARSNPWVELLKDRVNFQLEYEQQPPRGFIRNRKPQNGESEVLRATAMGSRPGDALGLVSYLPNIDGTGVIVSISGTNMEGTEAAAEILLDGNRFGELARRLWTSNPSRLPYFEAVIRARSFAGVGSAPEIVTIRRIGEE